MRILVLLTAFLTSCASVGTYQFSGNEGSSEITIESSMPNWIVNTYISTSEEKCKEFKSTGELFYDAQLRGGGFFGAMQKINPLRKDENISVTHRVPNNSTIQVKAYASYYAANMQGNCGPIVTKIRVGEGDNIKIHIRKNGASCDLSAKDVSSGQRVGEEIYCKSSFWGI